MGDPIETEAAAIIFPLKNTPQMRNQYSFIATVAPQVINLEQTFGPNWRQGFYTIEADGTKLYLSLGHTAGTIQDGPVGTGLGTGVGSFVDQSYCYPIPADQERDYTIPEGYETGSGVSQVLDYKQLHVKVPSGSTTGLCHIYRSSKGRHGTERFARTALFTKTT